MNWLNKITTCIIALALTGVSQTSYAGRSCEEAQASPLATAKAFDAAAGLQDWLNKTPAKVAIIARRGQDLSKYGLVYSHVGIAAKDDRGAWLFFHELNTCGSARSVLYQQGLAEFFADDLLSAEVAVAIPEPWLQARLGQIVMRKEELHRMHEPAYSAVAYPFSLKYQNSNGWVLETLARAASDKMLRDRASAQAWLKTDGYAPDVLYISTLTRLGGRMFKANIAFDDHPPELRWSSKITVNTADALLRYVSKYSLAQPKCHHGPFAAQICVVDPN